MIVFQLLSILCLGARAQKGQVTGAVVSSKEWKVTRSPERIEEFIGDVRYRTAADSIAADWALYKHAEDLWQARGHVRVERSLEGGDVVKASGQRAVWDRKREAGHLTGDGGVDFSRAAAQGEPDQGHAGLLEWRGQDHVELKEGLRVWGPRLEAWADRGVYSRSARRLDLSGGRPVLRKFSGWEGSGDWQGAVKADAISAFEGERALTADGRAVGWIVFPRAERR